MQEKRGIWSSFPGVRERIEAKGLFCSLYTDRGSHYWDTPASGGKVDRGQPDPVRAGDGAARDRDDPGILAGGAGPLGSARSAPIRGACRRNWPRTLCEIAEAASSLSTGEVLDP